MEDIYRLIELIKWLAEYVRLIRHGVAMFYATICPQKASVSLKKPKIGLIEMIEMIDVVFWFTQISQRVHADFADFAEEFTQITLITQILKIKW